MATFTNWKVTFVADYAVITTNVTATREDEALEQAERQLMYQHGLDVRRFSAEAEEVDA